MHPTLSAKILTPDAIAEQIQNGDVIGFSGFTVFGDAKVIPPAIAKRGKALRDSGTDFRISVYTGASTGDQLDGELARAGIVEARLPYQSNGEIRKHINSGDCSYVDTHLSHFTKLVRQGGIPRPTVAVIEACDVEIHGDMAHVYLTGAGGASATFLQYADRVYLEVNTHYGDIYKGMHDVWMPTLQPHCEVIPITKAGDRVGKPYVEIPVAKIKGVVPTDLADKKGAFEAPDHQSMAIANHILEFLAHERKMGRLPEGLPYQSGVGNVANAVLASMASDPMQPPLSMYTEVIQDSIFPILESGKLIVASGTSFSLSPEGQAKMKANAHKWKDKFILRQQEISNHPEVVRRLGTISMNTAIEMDIFGNVNSTHIMGSAMMNGIGGSGDFSRNAFLPIFMTTSTAKNGMISCVVPMVSHTDHHEHDNQIMVTEQGLADLRGLPPTKRARLMIEKCAHPDYKPLLTDYLEYGLKHSKGVHTPHTLSRAFEFHTRFLETGSMRP